jgi:hypothetical protein
MQATAGGKAGAKAAPPASPARSSRSGADWQAVAPVPAADKKRRRRKGKGVSGGVSATPSARPPWHLQRTHAVATWLWDALRCLYRGHDVTATTGAMVLFLQRPCMLPAILSCDAAWGAGEGGSGGGGAAPGVGRSAQAKQPDAHRVLLWALAVRLRAGKRAVGPLRLQPGAAEKLYVWTNAPMCRCVLMRESFCSSTAARCQVCFLRTHTWQWALLHLSKPLKHIHMYNQLYCVYSATATLS